MDLKIVQRNIAQNLEADKALVDIVRNSLGEEEFTRLWKSLPAHLRRFIER